jgi:ABC-type phosphate transport system ATPase subunit
LLPGLVDQADFAEAARQRTKGYSGGMKRQLNLMPALISDPEIVFLDEPAVGMDDRARRRTWEYIGSLKEQGKTVILTTHLPSRQPLRSGHLAESFDPGDHRPGRHCGRYPAFHKGRISIKVGLALYLSV